MSEVKADVSEKAGQPSAAAGDADVPVRAERRDIGKQLHQGILQDLTIAGLRLKVLQDGAPELTATALAEFAAWLRGRQAALRKLVSELEQGRPAGAHDLAAITAIVQQRHGCRLAVEGRLAEGEFDQGLWATMVETIGGVVTILADPLGARQVDVSRAENSLPILGVLHDGRKLADNTDQLVAIRALVGRGGASLRIEPGTPERLTLDWTD
jgi:hypothetical protein